MCVRSGSGAGASMFTYYLGVRGIIMKGSVNSAIRMLSAGIIIVSFFLPVISGNAAEPSGAERAKAQEYLENNLIAPCCFRQPIADHESQAAEDMKTEIAAMLAEGKTTRQIEDYYINKYGDKILAVPRMEGFNSMSFVMPVFIFAMGVLVILLTIRRMVMRNGPVKKESYVRKTNINDSMDDRIESELKDM